MSADRIGFRELFAKPCADRICCETSVWEKYCLGRGLNQNFEVLLFASWMIKKVLMAGHFLLK